MNFLMTDGTGHRARLLRARREKPEGWPEPAARLRGRGELLPPFLEFVLDAEIQGLADGVEGEADEAHAEQEGRIDRGAEPDAHECLGGLDRVGDVAIGAHDPAGHRTAEAEA